ncbi:putative glycosyltransferase EpsF [Ruminiclostridium hungatei]|uniref:Putative glycosyltransferase EpsF n=1 Tax=Ruminiclostridium hungatei TaxID=48256 RepID=A0A1V4SNJ3_RUMHU|nr:polysaccharide pyruvyl transferase CsaB [Ruminiclostridium hungatei]OPX45468.1 putative glycosyltransferase EpsF [Ruminiclostridium hungatei]
MKVLHIIGGGDVGGAKVHVINLVKELGSAIDVTLLCLRPGAFADDARAIGIKVEVIKSFNIYTDIKKAIRLVKNNKFDIIHSHGSKANIFAYAIKKACKTPVVTTIHSDYKLDYLQSLFKRLTIGVVNSHVLRKLDYYIVVTSAFRKMLVERGFSNNKIFTILNGMNMSKPEEYFSKEEFSNKYHIPLDSEDILVGTAARLDPVKDIGTFLEAARHVVKINPKVKFLIGGEGEQSKELKARSLELGLNQNVFFLGWLNNPYELISVLDINVMTSISEGFPYYLLEGARYSKATICSRVGGIPDLIESTINGFLFEPKDYMTLSKQILELAQDGRSRTEFGEKLYEKANRDFSLNAMRATQVSIYEDIRDISLRKAFPGRASGNTKYDVIISGYYGFRNIGDDAMLRSIVDNLKCKKPDISILVLSKKPLETSVNYNVHAINRKNMFAVYSAMKKAKLFIYGGGNIIQDSTSSRSLLFYLGAAWLAKKLGLKVMFYANGIGPINKNRNTEYSRKILNMADVITVREKISYNELEKMGITRPKIVLTADAALAVHVENGKTPEDIFINEGIPLDTGYAGFSVRKCPGSDKHQQATYEHVIAEAADYIYNNYNLLPVFIPMEYQADIFTIQNIVSKMKTNGYVVTNNHSVSETFGIIKKMDIMIGMRLHALIFAAYMNVPLIGISYQPKVEGFLEYIGQPSAGHVKDITFEALRTKIDQLLLNREEVKKELEKSVDILVAKADENSRLAIELIS